MVRLPSSSTATPKRLFLLKVAFVSLELAKATFSKNWAQLADPDSTFRALVRKLFLLPRRGQVREPSRAWRYRRGGWLPLICTPPRRRSTQPTYGQTPHSDPQGE